MAGPMFIWTSRRDGHKMAMQREVKKAINQSRLVSVLALAACLGMLSIGAARAEIKTQTIDYSSDVTLEGYLAYDDSIKEKRPGILIAHTRRGIGEFIR